jgi:hypothetical protein
MRTRSGWGFGAAVLIGFGISTASAADGNGVPADSPAAQTSSSGSQSWLPSWFGGKEKPATKPEKTATARSDSAASKGKANVEDRSPARDAISPSAVERSKYLRRLKVCDKLRGLAQDANDTELERMVDQLEERAYAVFLQRTAAPASGPEFESDEKTLEKRLPLSGTAGKQPSAGTASAQNNPGQSGRIREN